MVNGGLHPTEENVLIWKPEVRLFILQEKPFRWICGSDDEFWHCYWLYLSEVYERRRTGDGGDGNMFKA